MDKNEEVRIQHKEDLKEYMEHLTPKAKNNLEIVESTERNPFMLRIDNVVPKYFTHYSLYLHLKMHLKKIEQYLECVLPLTWLIVY